MADEAKAWSDEWIDLLWDDVRYREDDAHEACPCRRTYKCGGYSDHVCSGSYETPCRCEEPNTETARECTSSIHAAIRDLRREAFRAGLEAAAKEEPDAYMKNRILALAEAADGD